MNFLDLVQMNDWGSPEKVKTLTLPLRLCPTEPLIILYKLQDNCSLKSQQNRRSVIDDIEYRSLPINAKEEAGEKFWCI